jgi:phage-related protein
VKRSRVADRSQEKPIQWMGSSLDELSRFPARTKSTIGYALWLAQQGQMHDDAKPMHGKFSGLIEIVAHDDSRRTFRAVYVAKFAGVVYVLHAFCKKAKRGTHTPQRELDLIERRLRTARMHYEDHHGKNEE